MYETYPKGKSLASSIGDQKSTPWDAQATGGTRYPKGTPEQKKPDDKRKVKACSIGYGSAPGNDYPKKAEKFPSEGRRP